MTYSPALYVLSLYQQQRNGPANGEGSEAKTQRMRISQLRHGGCMLVTLAGRLESLGRAQSPQLHSISIPPPNFQRWLSLPSSPTLHPLTAPPDANPTQRSMAVSATFPRCGPFPGQRIKRGAISGGWVLIFLLEGWCGVMGEGCVIEAVIIRPAPFHFLQRVE